ncbi:hypothetical protein D3C81_1768430 [compost metagenome]
MYIGNLPGPEKDLVEPFAHVLDNMFVAVLAQKIFLVQYLSLTLVADRSHRGSEGSEDVRQLTFDVDFAACLGLVIHHPLVKPLKKV